jgi:hypothetical protein
MKFYLAIQKNAIISFEGKWKKLRLGDPTVVVWMLEAKNLVATQSMKQLLLNTYLEDSWNVFVFHTGT